MAVVWGFNFVSIKYLLRTNDPIDVMILRLVLASIFFGVLMVALSGGIPRFERADWGRLALVGFVGITITTTAVTFGTRLIPVALASLIVTTNPIFTALISRLVAGEPLTRRKLSGVSIAFIGFLIVLLYGGPEAQFSVQNVSGVMIVLCLPLSWAFYTVMSKPLLVRYDPIQFAGLMTIVGSIPILPLILLDTSILSDVFIFGPSQWLATINMTFFALVLAYILWYRGLRVLSPTQVAVYTYLVPVFGAFGAWLLLEERITIFLLLGGVTILAGVILTNTARSGTVDQNPYDPIVTTANATASAGVRTIPVNDATKSQRYGDEST